MLEPVIELKNVTKMYGKSRGVIDLTLNIPKGTIYGFLGPNGAGKTTTISMLVDLIRPTQGQIKIFGLDVKTESLKIRQHIGFLGGDMALDDSLTGQQQIEYFAHLRGTYDSKYILELAKKFDSDLSRKIKTLSRGNRQKVGLISALMHKPDLLILDEPTSGLDPLIQDEFNQIIHEYKNQGKTVFISSHILSEIEELCDHVAFVREGRLISDKPIDQITVGVEKQIRIVASDKSVAELLLKLSGVSKLKLKDGKITFMYTGHTQKLIDLLAKHEIKDLIIMPPDLDLIFSKFYGN